MAGIKALRKIQMGLETVAGTAVAATALWRGLGTMEDTREVVFPEEDVGLANPLDRNYIPKLAGEIQFNDIEATFEQIPYILESGIDSQTPAQDGTGSDYIYTYTIPTATQGDWKTYTIEAGDDNQAEEMEYAICTEFGIKGKAGEALMMSATWRGRQVTNTSYTGAISIPTIEDILFSRGRLYVNATSTYPATAQLTNTFLEMDLKVTTGLTPVFTGDGQLYFSFVKRQGMEVTLDITFEHDASAVAEKTAWRNQTARAVRIDFTGSALGTPGTTYSTKRFIIDLVGRWQKFDKIGDQDGNDIIKATLLGRYNATAATAGRFIVVNELTALP